jgi:hypothetical protein
MNNSIKKISRAAPGSWFIFHPPPEVLDKLEKSKVVQCGSHVLAASALEIL